MNLGKSILKHKKKLIYTILAFILSQICFFNLGGIGLENNVYAADGDTTTQTNSSQEWASKVGENMGTIQKIIYAFIFPLLVVAGKLVDNSFVYGEIFGFDAILWKLRNIVRNLANFGLGFLFVYHIFSYLLSKKGDMKKLLISTLIAGIGIQASWFVMAALIDMSTILTYSVGGLPISVLKNKIENSEGEDVKYNPYMLKNIIFVEAKNLDRVDKYLTNVKPSGDIEDFYISECKTLSFQVKEKDDKSVELLLAPSMIYYKDENVDKTVQIRQTESNACHFYNQVYYFKELYTGNNRGNCVDTGSCAESQREYDSALNSATTEIKRLSTAEVSSLIDQAKILEIGNAHISGGIAGKLGTVLYTGDLADYGVDLYNKKTGEGKTIRLDKILDGSSYVGVFSALYTSLINSVGIIPPDAGLYATMLNTALSVGHMIAIGIPLIVVAVIFMIRIGILWVAIAISPFIVLLKAFDLDSKVFKGDFLECFQVIELIKVIFSPVIICFAISISTVLVTILSGVNVDSIDSVKTEILGGLIKLDIGGFTVSIGKLIVSLLGIAITRFLVWAAVESGSKLGSSSIVKSLKGLAETTLGAIPIVPVVRKDAQGKPMTKFIGANSAFGLNGQTGIISNVMNKTKSIYHNEENNLIEDIVNHDRVVERSITGYKKEIANIDTAKLTDDWRKIITLGEGENGIKFDGLPDNKKTEIINAINALSDDDRRQALGTSAPEVKFNDGSEDVTYVFDQTKKQYVKNPK